jgi:ABC-2 type transport system permease protein
MKGFFSIAGLRRLRVMTWKELLQLLRDTALMVFFLYSFTGDIYVAASGVSMQLRNAASRCSTTTAASPRGSWPAASSRRISSRPARPPAPTPASSCSTGDAMAVLDIPPRFEERLTRGEQVPVQLQDTTNSVLGFLASSYAAQIVGRYAGEVAMLRKALPAAAAR